MKTDYLLKKTILPTFSMSFKVSDINSLISSFLHKEDIVSFLKSSRELRNDLHNIPFKNFIFSQQAGMVEIKALMHHLDVVEILEVNGCDFVTDILLPMKRLKTLILKNCKIPNPELLRNRVGPDVHILLY